MEKTVSETGYESWSIIILDSGESRDEFQVGLTGGRK